MVSLRRVFGIHLFSDPGRWIGPVSLAALTPLVLADRDSWAGTAMLATSQAEYATLILGPVAVAAGALSAKSAALHDPFLASGGVRNRAVPLSLVVGAAFGWIAMACVGLWVAVAAVSVGASVAGRPFSTTLGVALSALLAATTLGAFVGKRVRSAWIIVALPIATYIVLAVPTYFPNYALFVLVPRSSNFFFSLALPNPVYASTQIAWMIAVAAALVLWDARIGRRPFIGLGTAAVATICVAVALTQPLLRGRSGVIELGCASTATRGVTVCLWVDHEPLRSAVEAEVAKASAIAGELPRFPAVVTEADFGTEGPPRGLSSPGGPVVSFTVGVRVDEDRLMARIAASSLRANPGCATLNFAELPYIPIPDVVVSVLSADQSPWGNPQVASRATVSQQRQWLSGVQESWDRCEPPLQPTI